MQWKHAVEQRSVTMTWPGVFASENSWPKPLDTSHAVVYHLSRRERDTMNTTTATENRDRIAEEVALLQGLIADLRMQAIVARGRDLPSMSWEFAGMGDMAASIRLEAEADQYVAILKEHIEALREADDAVIAELPAVEPEAGFVYDGRCRMGRVMTGSRRTVAEVLAAANRRGW